MSTRAELEKRRDELIKRLAAIRADFKRGLDADSEEQAQQLENRDVLLEIERVSEEELQKVQQQLIALDDE